MTLSAALHSVTITLCCPHCGHSFAKKGSWVKVIRQYVCESCHQRVRMDYLTKVALFEAHARPSEGEQEDKQVERCNSPGDAEQYQ
jgi:uncharacterized protein YlaI